MNLIVWVICARIATSFQPLEALRHVNKHDRWTHSIRGEYIPLEYFNAMTTADLSKQALQNQLRNFIENLQKNLTTSAVLSVLDDPSIPNSRNHLDKLYELSDFFSTTSEVCRTFGRDSESFYEVAKNTSYTLLLHLRQIPTTQPTPVKMLLTSYFAEMEFFHIMFSEIIDEVLEYTQNTLLGIQNTFTYYADLQRFVLQNWNFKADTKCCREYMDFLQLYSSRIFKCSAGHDLNVAYDVFAMAEITSKYIMRQLEFRIQRLFNCFYFGNFEIRCKFLQNAEQDFEVLFNKIEDLEIYYDIKTNRGRVSALRQRRRRSSQETSSATSRPQITCIPKDFPQAQMEHNLKNCFYNIQIY